MDTACSKAHFIMKQLEYGSYNKTSEVNKIYYQVKNVYVTES